MFKVFEYKGFRGIVNFHKKKILYTIRAKGMAGIYIYSCEHSLEEAEKQFKLAADRYLQYCDECGAMTICTAA